MENKLQETNDDIEQEQEELNNELVDCQELKLQDLLKTLYKDYNKLERRTQKQRQVALSSAEAEFVAMSAACKDLANIREKTRAILRIDRTPLLIEDNKAAIKLAKTEESQTLRHLVNLYYHFVRAEVKAKHVNIEWICSKEQLEQELNDQIYTKLTAGP